MQIFAYRSCRRLYSIKCAFNQKPSRVAGGNSQKLPGSSHPDF